MLGSSRKLEKGLIWCLSLIYACAGTADEAGQLYSIRISGWDPRSGYRLYSTSAYSGFFWNTARAKGQRGMIFRPC